MFGDDDGGPPPNIDGTPRAEGAYDVATEEAARLVKPRKPSAPSMGCLVPHGLETSLAASLAASPAASLSASLAT